jgi:hypothetical protein
VSRDRKFLLFSDQSQSAGSNYAVALRDLNRGTVVRLGEGLVGPLSPDGKWAAATISSTGDFVLYPTGAGEAVRLPRGSIEQYQTTVSLNLQWFPDGRRVLVCGNEQGKASRCYEQDIAGQVPKPATPEGIGFGLLAEDGRTLLAKTITGAYQVLTLHDGAGVPAKGFSPEDYPLAWTSDSRAVIVAIAGAPAHIVKVDPVTGGRTELRQLMPPAGAGVNLVWPGQWIEDGRGYVYMYSRELSRLFVATGVSH